MLVFLVVYMYRVSLGKRIDNKDENELTEGSTFPSTTESTFTMKKVHNCN